MLGPIGVLEREIFPEVQAYVVHALKDEKQIILAEKLGITQAMVSKYLLKKPVKNEIVEQLGKKLIGSIRNNLSNEEISGEITELSFNLMQSGRICPICSKMNSLRNCNACMQLNIPQERVKIIENLKKSIEIIEKENPIELMPNVMINIAMKTQNAGTKADVASVPGRIVKIKSKLKASNPPEFGVSSHLAGILLGNKKFNAVTNIKCSKEIESSLKKAKIKDILIDRGGFGIEPCIYIFGKDAIDVSNKLVKINREVKNEGK